MERARTDLRVGMDSSQDCSRLLSIRRAGLQDKEDRAAALQAEVGPVCHMPLY